MISKITRIVVDFGGKLMEKYKLRITTSWYQTKTKEKQITASFVWDKKDDALACKELLQKADRGSQRLYRTHIEFVVFTEEQAL